MGSCFRQAQRAETATWIFRAWLRGFRVKQESLMIEAPAAAFGAFSGPALSPFGRGITPGNALATTLQALENLEALATLALARKAKQEASEPAKSLFDAQLSLSP